MNINHTDLKRFISEIMISEGMSEPHAGTLAEVVTWANLRGADSHGVIRIPQYLKFISNGDLDPLSRPELVLDTGAVFMIDAHKSAGQVAMSQAVDKALELASQFGVGWGVVRSTTHTGAVGYYAQKIAENNMIGLVTAATIPLMAYHGLRVISLGTSPIAIAVPSGNGEPILFDMATSVASMGKINQARIEQAPIPEGWALSKDGRQTSCADDAMVLLPMSGAKGSGLALMLEFVNSVLAGAPILARMITPGADRWHTHNACCVAVNIENYRDPGDFRSDVDELSTILQSLPMAEGVEEIRMPGTRGDRSYAERLESGIPIPDGLWSQLSEIAEEKGVKLPTLF